MDGGTVVEVEMDSTIGKESSCGMLGKNRNRQVDGDEKSLPCVVIEDQNDQAPPEIKVLLFDYSVENHFEAVDIISKLSGESEWEYDQSQIGSLSSSITFLREWRQFCYQPRIINFACQNESPQVKDVIGVITLPQFSAAAVPKEDGANGNKISTELSKDFIMYVGGLVWALDWCPVGDRRPASDIKTEFIAVAAHPPESSYHKIGAPLTGRGVIQIWCLLNVGGTDEDVLPQVKQRSKKNLSSKGTNLETAQPKKPRGRPRKRPINEANNLDGNCEYVQALSVQFPENSFKLLPTDAISSGTLEQVAIEDTPRNGSSSSVGVFAKLQQSHRSTDAIDFKSSEPQKPRGRPRKKPVNESVNKLEGSSHNLQPPAVVFPENPSKSFLLDGILHEQVAKEDTSRNQNVTKEGISAERQQRNARGIETINVKSSQTQKPRGRPRKKPIKGSVDNLDGSHALTAEFPGDTSKLLPTDTIFADEIAKEDTVRNQNDAREGISAEQKEENARGNENINVKSSQPGKPKERRGKKLINEHVDNSKSSNQCVALAVKLPEDIPKMLPTVECSSKNHDQVTKKEITRKRKGSNQVSEDFVLTSLMHKRMKDRRREKGGCSDTDQPLLTPIGETSLANHEMTSSCRQDPVVTSDNITVPVSFETTCDRNSIPGSVALPRVVLCLAHNGKVAWDVKWRPSDSCTKSKHIMGYLAVLLGNGALEVWEVPLPRAVKGIYSACPKEGTDPRFLKLEPVFRCSMLKCGDRQSIPLTAEWSASYPHDRILAGCHDGVVALWKFSTSCPSKDTRPLLCFSADTVPIRTLAWAPVESDPESANVIVTGGHKGLKFWDIRDPFRPLWDLNPGQRIIYSMDWLPDPRCVVLSFDDGELRILSLLKAAYDVPVTGKPFVGTQQQGLHSYYCSSSAIWSVQVSRLTGMVAYCCADGTVLRFQLTTRAVEKDPLRNRAPHFLCGSLTKEESALTVISPLPDVPFPMRKSLTKMGNAPRTKRGYLSISNQERRAKEQMAKVQTSEDQPLAICYGNDPGGESPSEDTLMTSKQKPKTKSSGKRQTKTDQALLACSNNDPDNRQREEESGNQNKVEAFPPKIVAMHKVRWNMNKGSERWLCYGGAGGIVRCQQI